MRACLNLNETGPLKVSAEQAETLFSAANGVLMIQRCFCVSCAQVTTQATPLTHTHPSTQTHIHTHMDSHIKYIKKNELLNRHINHSDTGIDKTHFV